VVLFDLAYPFLHDSVIFSLMESTESMDTLTRPIRKLLVVSCGVWNILNLSQKDSPASPTCPDVNHGNRYHPARISKRNWHHPGASLPVPELGLKSAETFEGQKVLEITRVPAGCSVLRNKFRVPICNCCTYNRSIPATRRELSEISRNYPQLATRCLFSCHLNSHWLRSSNTNT
jgi:hypothetical protein